MQCINCELIGRFFPQSENNNDGNLKEKKLLNIGIAEVVDIYCTVRLNIFSFSFEYHLVFTFSDVKTLQYMPYKLN